MTPWARAHGPWAIPDRAADATLRSRIILNGGETLQVNRFALFAAASGRLFDSAQAEDHMVTFQVTGNGNQYGRDFSPNLIGAFVIAWEDLP